MPTKRHAGSRSTLEVLERAAAIYQYLIEEDATAEELIAHVRETVGESAYGKAPRDALRHDLNSLRQLGFEVEVIAPGYHYRLVDFKPRFPLPFISKHIETLAAVRRALEDTLYSDVVEDLIERIRVFLLPELRPLLDREPLLKLSGPLLDDLTVHQAVLEKFRRARDQRRRIGFLYRSPQVARSRPIQHSIELELLEERDGHVYFEGFSADVGQMLQFRLDRVEADSVEVLPNVIPGKRQRPAIPIRYRLSPAVARLGATPRFSNHHEKTLEEGWVEISGETPDLFWASKKLLKYGENCIVMEPPQLVKEMKRVISVMARNYEMQV